MKIKKCGNAVTVSQDGRTIFTNRTKKGYSLKTTESVERSGARWLTAWLMDMSAEEFQRWVSLLCQLAAAFPT